MATKETEEYAPIEDYGIIGNLSTAALVSKKGSLDFMCLPRFDSPTVFCKLLDAEKGGQFAICPQMKDMVTKQLYLPDTNILVTRFLADEGIAELIDFMGVADEDTDCRLIRKLTAIKGTINFTILCAPRFDYARMAHTLSKESPNRLQFTPEKPVQPSLRLHSNIALEMTGQDATASFTLKESENACFVLHTCNQINIMDDLAEYVETSYRTTMQYWHAWISQSN
jgi:GH15 family glucan-1,4-alpha-glucosidase